MLFNSPEFIFAFLPVTALVFFLLARRTSTVPAVSWLVLASLFFYAWWNPLYLAVILLSMAVNYGVGLALSRGAARARSTRPLLIVGIAFNLALLGYFKYADFLVGNLNAIADLTLQPQDVVLPLAISFFTFQQITFLVDAWHGDAHEYSALHYALFVTFFPQLIAGPIVHHREILPQFAQAGTFTPQIRNIAVGLTIFTLGLFKKVVLADNLAAVASPIFAVAETGASLDFFSAWRGALAYTFQLYFDFSGYSDMAIGIARIFGIRLPLNFDSPYRATNIIEFWRRWHMTLSRFLRDYVYIPLGGSRHGATRRYTNLLATMLLGGLWHGAGWTFVFWGGLHGFYLIVNHLWQRVWRRSLQTWWSITLARLTTFFCVVVAWVFFRAESFGGALAILDGMRNLPRTLSGRIGIVEDLLRVFGLRFDGNWVSDGDMRALVWLGFWLAVCWYLPNTQQLLARFEPALAFATDGRSLPLLQRLLPQLYWAPNRRWSLLLGVMAAVALSSLSRVSEFLYFQF